MPKLANNRIGFCPECGSEIRLRKAPHLGQQVTCPICKSKLEVVNRNPVELDWVEDDSLAYE
jgi:lysine biosynthesis protein LysW